MLPNRVLAVGNVREDAGFEHFLNRLLRNEELEFMSVVSVTNVNKVFGSNSSEQVVALQDINLEIGA
ncbi:MAG: hypothetical protein AAB217_27665, partial [Chloroflexota bacterium]